MVRFAAALLIQVLIVGGLVVAHQLTLSRGTAVYLSIAPVDPRDPLRGDFVTIGYDISSLDMSLLAGSGEGPGREPSMPRPGDVLFVPLSRAGKTWIAGPGVSGSLPDIERDTRGYYDSNTVFIRGAVQSTSARTIRMVYGIEEYFIAEGTGATWPTAGTPDATGRVIVGDDGQAVLQQVYLDGMPWP